jgi:aromatic-L-amino-acid decarboxylase
MTNDQNFHMPWEDFRRNGQALLDWLIEYHRKVDQFPVQSQVPPGHIRDLLPAEPPQKGEPFEDILQDVDEIIVPGLTHWQSPNFFAFFPANSSGPAVLGDLLSAGLGV